MDGFSVITMNLRFGLADDGENSWRQRKKIYPDFLQRFRADIFCFQEANDFQVDFLKELLPDYQVLGCREGAPEQWQHNPVFVSSAFTVAGSRHFFLSDTPDVESRFEGSRWPRQGVLVQLDSSAGRFAVLNTHFDFAEDVQVKSAALMLSLLRMNPENLPVLLAGDLNAGPCSAALELLTGGGEQRFRNPFGADFPPTFHGFTGRGRGDQIDWILVSGPLEVKGMDRLDVSLGGLYPSDHFPVRLFFRLE
ncbi:endonuclease/exonuclease/phosphatase family protein [Desulfobotulus sp. H1]|uniref:Endonuclease/exonuclease/phosphatase family protein n=1 Tax=Desulfobotulus pelophilus TaxID=2823377 RepID=A0ABT3N8U4_9BACT|nr:endonuclease/exonuclease/phosphatase family protein [Desulfobotulus pelophilus]MCW7753616.1 endonuclease/exonuclease/phosphatase family protein [Desulfobotulus pelophilus]